MADEKAFKDLVNDSFLAPFFDSSFQPEAYVRSIVRKVCICIDYLKCNDFDVEIIVK